ncbi:tyrosine-type recombinase/integrase [Anatilimnocola floriformis]|uniref:tyrosine-type recombinase/integrase n=1 Tax=Anatilimnocola floriformis TaxID=2948575 RepID=UPI0020C2BBF9|nr:tyrosine-type recombinase/integrase [Anatilimnocola floriformis]
MTELLNVKNGKPSANLAIPPLIATAGDAAAIRFLEFFAASIRNRGTRKVYAQAIGRFFSWCESQSISLTSVKPLVVATYIEQLAFHLQSPTVKLHLAAIRSLFDYLVTGQIVPFNPAASVRGPKHVVRKGKTPVLIAADARILLDSIETDTLIGLRDRALIGTMVYSFARVSATVGMDVEDYFSQGRRMWFRLHEKGGKHHEVPAHHKAEEYLDAYLAAAMLEPNSPLFRTVSKSGALTSRRMHRTDSLRMVKRRALAAGLASNTCNHTFRATGITAYLTNGGLLEHAQQIAAHESPRSTKLYDRTSDAISLDEIERIIL